MFTTGLETCWHELCVPWMQRNLESPRASEKRMKRLQPPCSGFVIQLNTTSEHIVSRTWHCQAPGTGQGSLPDTRHPSSLRCGLEARASLPADLLDLLLWHHLRERAGAAENCCFSIWGGDRHSQMRWFAEPLSQD